MDRRCIFTDASVIFGISELPFGSEARLKISRCLLEVCLALILKAGERGASPCENARCLVERQNASPRFVREDENARAARYVSSVARSSPPLSRSVLKQHRGPSSSSHTAAEKRGASLHPRSTRPPTHPPTAVSVPKGFPTASRGAPGMPLR